MPTPFELFPRFPDKPALLDEFWAIGLCPFTVQDQPVPETSSEKQLAGARQVGAARILKSIRDSDYVVALDVQGKQISSPELSRWIQERGLAGAIDGPMTFPHQFMPLLLAEQLYRAVRIAAGEAYHR